MKFYNEKGQVFEAASVKELISNIDLKDADSCSICCHLFDLQVEITFYYLRSEKYELVEISRFFRVLNPDAKSITDRYNKNGYKGRTFAKKSSDVAQIVKQILKKVGKENASHSAKFYNDHIDELKKGLANKFKKAQFLERAKAFKSELKTLMDKYGFEFEGRAESYYDTYEANASLYIRETGSEGHKIEIMSFENDEEIEFPEMEVGSVE